MAEALAVVNVGNREWLFTKFTPCSRTQSIVGESTELTDPARNPSKTKITIFRVRPPTGLSCAGRIALQTGHTTRAATNQTNLLFIPSLLLRENYGHTPRVAS